MTSDQEAVFNMNMDMDNLERKIRKIKGCIAYSTVVFLLMCLSSFVTLNNDVIPKLGMVVLALNSLVICLSIRDISRKYNEYKTNKTELNALLIAVQILRQRG